MSGYIRKSMMNSKTVEWKFLLFGNIGRLCKFLGNFNQAILPVHLVVKQNKDNKFIDQMINK